MKPKAIEVIANEVIANEPTASQHIKLIVMKS
jgi:hypothetical protein